MERGRIRNAEDFGDVFWGVLVVSCGVSLAVTTRGGGGYIHREEESRSTTLAVADEPESGSRVEIRGAVVAQ